MTHNFIPTITLPTIITDNSIKLIDHIQLKTTSKDINEAIVMGNIYIVTSQITYLMFYLYIIKPTILAPKLV